MSFKSKTIEIEVLPEPTFDPDLPSYRDCGRILLMSHGPAKPYDSGNPSVYRWDTEIIDYDGCVFWISEGEGFDYWLNSVGGLEIPGVYVIDGIYGCYHRGDGWTTDDDVTWDYGVVRPATEAEIKSECLS